MVNLAVLHHHPLYKQNVRCKKTTKTRSIFSTRDTPPTTRRHKNVPQTRQQTFGDQPPARDWTWLSVSASLVELRLARVGETTRTSACPSCFAKIVGLFWSGAVGLKGVGPTPHTPPPPARPLPPHAPPCLFPSSKADVHQRVGIAWRAKGCGRTWQRYSARGTQERALAKVQKW